MARKKVIKAFVNDEEKARAESIAAAEGLTISAYIRRCFLFAQPPAQPTKRAA